MKDANENDLWSFDDDAAPLEEKAAAAARELEPPMAPAPTIPAARDAGRKKVRESSDPSVPKAVSGGESIRVNVNRKLPKVQFAGPLAGQPILGNDFDDLDHWDKAEDATVIEEIPEAIAPAPRPARASAPEPAPEPAPPADEQDEFSPRTREDATPVSLRPHLGLSLVERIGLGVLVALLLAGGGLLFYNAIHRLPTGSARVKENDFPIAGRHLSVQSASSYWRAPVTDGANADTVRRGTQLIPVVSLTSSGGPAAVRVFFRNGEGELVGDAVTRMLRADTPLQVAATAGFDDVGMHAAYRTGQSKTWIVQVHEAQSESSAVSDFTKLFEMNISTDRR